MDILRQRLCKEENLSLSFDGWTNVMGSSVYGFLVIFADRNVAVLDVIDLSKHSHTGKFVAGNVHARGSYVYCHIPSGWVCSLIDLVVDLLEGCAVRYYNYTHQGHDQRSTQGGFDLHRLRICYGGGQDPDRAAGWVSAHRHAHVFSCSLKYFFERTRVCCGA